MILVGKQLLGLELDWLRSSCSYFWRGLQVNDTFSDGDMNLVMSSMFLPESIMRLSLKPAETKMQNSFAKALAKFTKEDPTLRVRIDDETKETVISGMGELHLEVYIEHMKREYKYEVISGQPNVN